MQTNGVKCVKSKFLVKNLWLNSFKEYENIIMIHLPNVAELKVVQPSTLL